MAVQILPSTDPWASVWERLGANLGKIQEDKRQYNDASKFLTDYKAKTEAANQLQSDYDRSQREADFANKYLSLKKNWDDNSAGGTLSDELKQSIINHSRALRHEATANGYNLLGEDTDYNTARIKNYDDQNSRIAQIAAGLGKMNIDASKFLPQSDMGHDAGASQRPTYDPNTSFSGLGKLVNQQYGKYNDPATYKAAAADYYASHDMSPDALKRIAPLLQAQQDELNNSKSIQLIAQIQNTKDPTEKAALTQQYYDLKGKDGLGIIQGFTPQHKTAEVNRGNVVEVVDVQTPGVLSGGQTTVTTPYSKPMEIPPGTQAQLNLQEKTQADNSALNWARLANDANSIKHYMTTDSGDVIGFSGDGQAHRLANVSSFSKSDQMKIKALQNNMTSALQLYKASANQYDPTAVTPGMQQAMDNYNSSKSQLDSMLGLNKGNSTQQDPVAKMIDQAKASNYSKEQILDMLHNKGYNEYDSYVW